MASAIISSIGKINPKMAQILAIFAEIWTPRKLINVSNQKEPIIKLTKYNLLFPKAGLIKNDAVAAMKDKMVGYPTMVLIHCNQMAKKPTFGPNASLIQL